MKFNPSLYVLNTIYTLKMKKKKEEKKHRTYERFDQNEDKFILFQRRIHVSLYSI